MGHQMTLERQVAADPAAVWAVLTDLDGAEATLSGVTAIEVLTEGPYAVGTTWRETRTMMGRSETQEMTVTEVHKQHGTVVAASQGGVDYRTEFTLAPSDTGTLLTMTFGAEQPRAGRVARLAGAVLGRLGLRVARKAMRTDLDDIARAAESR